MNRRAPERLAIDPRTTAVIVVDMQNDFGAEGGMFARAGIPIADIKTVVDPIAHVLRAARRVRMKVIYLTMQFEPDLSNAPSLCHGRAALGCCRRKTHYESP